MVAGSLMSAAVPGAVAWDFIVGDRFIAALAAPAPDAGSTALAEAAGDERVQIESLVGAIPTGGAGQVDSFAIVWWPGADPTEVTAVVRGNAVVDLTSPGGTRRFDARGIRPWHLAEFTDVVALRITTADAPLDRLGGATDPVPHARASLCATSIEWESAPHAARDAARALRDAAASAADADTILVPRSRLPHHADADTVRTTRRPADVPTTPIVIPAFDLELPGRAATGEAAPMGTSQLPEGSAPSPEDTAVPEFLVPAFRVGTGAARPVTAPVLIGRRPLPPRIAGSGAAHELVTVDSPHAVVSGTHLELRVEGTRLVATDLRSTNGTVVHGVSGSRRMRSGESIVVAPGTSLDLGDDTIIEISLAPAPGAPGVPAARFPTDSRPHP
ncbi:FHA domain-containing protein [Agromyces sp. NPDC049794]|uniref:FHA domain-containing protein n=1 Tax=unclassified Agromyces TaxID=2639701 RepID=UPI0033EF72A4